MRKTKDLILQTALNMFAQRGFSAVSLRDIAGALELTPPALYVHFRNKLDILETILRQMEERDSELSVKENVPSLPFEQAQESYAKVEIPALLSFTMEMYRYWTEDEFAVQFRRLLTLEQYRDSYFADLFQQYLGEGVINYLTDIFRAMFPGADARSLALSFYSPMFFLICQSDHLRTKKARAEAIRRLKEHLVSFAEKQA